MRLDLALVLRTEEVATELMKSQLFESSEKHKLHGEETESEKNGRH